MKTTIGIFDSHDLAVQAIIDLKVTGFPVGNLTLMGLLKTEQMDEQEHVNIVSPLKPAGIEIGTILGTTLGVLTGIGIFVIPGVGFLFGAGALAGAIAGFDIGLIGGGVATVLSSIGVKDEIADKYHDALVAGKFLVVANGREIDVNKAKALLMTKGTQNETLSY